MNDEDFSELIRHTKLSPKSRQAARLVFVEDMQQQAAADEVGISKQRMSQIVNVVRSVEERLREEAELVRLRQGQGLAANVGVAAIDASYAMVVKSAREVHGDDAQILSPNPNGKSVGEVLARTEFHLAQSVGREAVVIHDLSKLDRVPPIGRNVSISYADGRGVVADRGRDGARGGLAR
jgi:hypothetical protein